MTGVPRTKRRCLRSSDLDSQSSIKLQISSPIDGFETGTLSNGILSVMLRQPIPVSLLQFGIHGGLNFLGIFSRDYSLLRRISFT